MTWILLALAPLAMVGCPLLGLGTPVLSIEPLAFDFPPDKPVDAFTIVNSGSGTLTWSITFDAASAPWLTISPLMGTLTSTVQIVTLTIDRAQVPLPDATVVFTVTSDGGDQEISVHAVASIPVAPPTLDVSPLTVDLGGSGTMGSFVVMNAGSGTLDWTLDATALPSFITLVPPGGSLGETASQTVMVEIDRSQVPVGQTVNVPVTSNGGSATVQVVIAVQDLTLIPTTLDFGTGGTTATFIVQNDGTSAFDWSVANLGTLPTWVTSIVANSGTVVGGGQQVVTVDVSRAGQSAGDLQTDVMITSTGGDDTLSLLMTVQAFTVTPNALAFGATTLSALVTVGNIGPDIIDWSASFPPDLIWLSLSKTGGSLDPGTTDTFRVDIDRAGLPPGPFQGTISLTSNAGDAAVDVTMTVPLPQPTLTASPITLNFGATQVEKSVAIWNSGIGTIDWTLDTNTFPPWLTLTPVDGLGIASGTVTGTDTDLVRFFVDRDAVAVGGTFAFDATVSGISGGAPVTPVVIAVSMTKDLVPIIRLDSNVLIPEDQVTGTFEVRNDPLASGDLEWEIDVTAVQIIAPWFLSIEPSRGILAPGQARTVTITIDRNALDEAQRFELFINSNDPNPNPFNVVDPPQVPFVIIQVAVPPLPAIFVSRFDIDVGRNETTEVFDVANIGDVGTTLFFRVEVDPADRRWLFVNPPSGRSERFPSFILDRVPIFISINRAELDPDGDTGFAIGKLTIIPMETPGGPDIPPEIVAPSDPITVAVAPSPLTFETAIARTRIPSLVRWVLMMRNIKSQTIPFELTLADIDGSLDIDGNGFPDGVTDNAVSFAELQVILPDVTQAQFDSIDIVPNGSIDSADITAHGGDPFPELFLEHFTPKFVIFENDQPAEVVESSQFLTSGTKAKTDVVILLDYSASMFEAALLAQASYADLIAQGLVIDNPIFNGFPAAGDPLQFMYEACIGQFINELPGNYRVALMEFHDRGIAANFATRVVQPLTRNNASGKLALIAALNGINIIDHGASEVFLSALDATAQLANEDARLFLESFDDADVRAVILFSDGRVTTPPGEVAETIDAIDDFGVRIFSIGWGSESNSAILSRLSTETGGHFYAAFPSFLQMTDAFGNVIEVEIPNVDEIYDWCFTATSPLDTDRNALFQCDQAIAKDLKTQVVFSYVTLNEESNTLVRVNADFDDPSDNLGTCLRNQFGIDGNYSQQLRLADVVGNIRLGQISFSTEGVDAAGRAEIITRAEYIPRSINKFEMTFVPIPDSVELIPSVDGGLVGDWALQNLGGGRFRLDAPAGEVLQYADFGDMFRLIYNAVAPFTLTITIDNTIYISEGDFEPKFFTYPDSIPVLDQAPFFAPAFPTPRVRCLDCVQQFVGPFTEINIGAAANVRLGIRNVGGNYPYPNASNILTEVFLTWLAITPSDLEIIPLEGFINTTFQEDIIFVTPDRDIQEGPKQRLLTIRYTAASVNIEGEIQVLVDWVVGAPVFDTTPVNFDFDGVTPQVFTFLISNLGESSIAWNMLDTDLFPDWLSSSRTTGTVSESDPVDTVKLTIDPSDAIDPIQSFTIFIEGRDLFTGQLLGTKIVTLTLVP